MAKALPRCVGTQPSGQQCGRRVADGSNPPMCHLHRPGTTHGFQRTDDPQKVIAQLLRSRDEKIRLRAAELLTEWKRDEVKECPTCSADKAKDIRRQAALIRLTPDQRDTLAWYMREVNALLDSALTQPVYEEPVVPFVSKHKTTAGLPPQLIPVEKPKFEEPPEPFQLDKSKWAECGIFMLKGTPSHVLGDQYARDIIDGKITFDEAIASEELARKHQPKGPVSQVAF